MYTLTDSGRDEYERLRDALEPFLDQIVTSITLIKQEIYGTKHSLTRKERVRVGLRVPSAPPSKTSSAPSSQIARAPSAIAPGRIASKLLDSEHAQPVASLSVCAHGTISGNRKSTTVAGSSCTSPLRRVGDAHVIRARSSPP